MSTSINISVIECLFYSCDSLSIFICMRKDVLTKATRDSYGEELAQLVQKNKKIVVLDADLAGSTKSSKAKEVASERFIECGIAEGNMIGIAAGLAASGYIPFASSFAIFSAGRAWEQIRNSVALSNFNVKITGSHAGITVGEDGATHQALEDISVMRSIPNMTVLVPCDDMETKACVDYMASHTGPMYLRTGRSKVEEVYNSKPDITKIHVLMQGNTGITVFACGLEVHECLKAARMLENDGINISVVDVPMIKPFNKEGIVDLLRQSKIVFTVEEHNVIGGLGSMLAELSCEYCPRPIHRIGVQNCFGQTGSANELLKHYKLDAEGIYKQIKSYLHFESRK